MGAALRTGDVVALRGAMGAGKTAFVRGLALGLGLDDQVSSPTFALIHEYRNGPHRLCHMDMYRIRSLDDAESAGFFDYLDGSWIVAAEWSENIKAALPGDAVIVAIEIVDEAVRRIDIGGIEL